MRHTRFITFIILICFIFTTVVIPNPIYAEVIKDYRDVIYKNASEQDIYKPTAQFGMKLNNGSEVNSYLGRATGYDSPPLVVIQAKIGDKVSILDHSTSNNGSNIDTWDFQVSIPGQGMDAGLYSSSAAYTSKFANYTLSVEGTYNFYLCVRDYLSVHDKQEFTNGWGNWSENGNHRPLGINPGLDGIKGTRDDFNGWWYYTQIRVVVSSVKPNADFIIKHGNVNVTDNSTQKINRLTSNLVVNLVDNSTIESGSITKRVWKYWNPASGWVSIPGQGTNDTSINVDSTAIGINPNRMGFQLEVTSGLGKTDNAAHDVYSINATTGAGTIIVHHKDTGGSTLVPDDIVKTDLDKPTEVYCQSIPYYVSNKLSDIVTVPITDVDKTVEYTFTYTHTPALPPTLPPTVWIHSNDTVIMGNDIDIDGTGTDPKSNPISYSWEVSPSSWMQGTLSGTSSTVWFNQVGNVNVTLTGTTSGGSDTDTKQIRVLPPTPQVILVSPLSIRANHKLTISAINSTSGSQRYTLDWPKSIWEISITDSSQGLTLNDIKTLLPYSLAINVQGKQVIRIVGDYKQIEILSKKQGKINVYSQLTNTANYTGFASREIEILPDLPPIIGVSVTKETLRDPEDANLAPIDLIDTSTSPDGDTIGKRVWFYAFDSDNDSLFTDEIWYVLDNNVWQPVTNYGISGSYLSLKDINIDLVNDGNKQMVLFKSNSVGVRMFGLIIRENLNNVNSIPVFITPSDMQKSSTFE